MIEADTILYDIPTTIQNFTLMKTLIIAMLFFTGTMFADPPEHANNDNEHGNGHHNGWGNDDDTPDTPLPYTWVLAIGGLAIAFSLTKNKRA